MIKRAVFTVGGLGTRFLPATKAVPKEMLTVVDRPLIQYAVDDAIAAGVSELVFITSKHKKVLEDHYDDVFELRRELERAGKRELLQALLQVIPSGVGITFVRQPEPKGVAHALWCARHLLADQPFLLAYPDDLITGTPSACQELVQAFSQTGAAVLGVQAQPEALHSMYGMLEVEATADDSLLRVRGMVEKPKGKAPSPYAAVGRYVITPDVFARVLALSSSSQKEWPFVDALAAHAVDDTVFAKVLSGRRFDCGSKLGFWQANVVLGLQHPELGAAARAWLNEEAS